MRRRNGIRADGVALEPGLHFLADLSLPVAFVFAVKGADALRAVGLPSIPL